MTAFWQIAAHSVDHMFSCILTTCICNFSYFLFWFRGRNLGSDCSSSWSLHTCYSVLSCRTAGTARHLFLFYDCLVNLCMMWQPLHADVRQSHKQRTAVLQCLRPVWPYIDSELLSAICFTAPKPAKLNGHNNYDVAVIFIFHRILTLCDKGIRLL